MNTHRFSGSKWLWVILVALIIVACGDDGGEQNEPDEDVSADVSTDTPGDDTHDTTNPGDVEDVGDTGDPDVDAPEDVVDAGDADTTDAPVGLTQRPANPSCVAPPRVVMSGPVVWENAEWGGADGLNLMMIRQTPEGGWFEIYRSGEVFHVDASGQRSASLLSVPVSTDGEMGLLGFDIHPGWPAEPYIFFYYAVLEGTGHIRVARYTATPSATAPTIDASSAEVILDIDRGHEWGNHVGGSIEFDPTSATPMLYVATGDAELDDEAQNPASMLGKLLRVDVSAAPYTPEMVALGLRNPFRWSFDSATGDLWIGDVGDADWEEVNHIPAAQLSGGAPLNLGWPIMEGFMCRTGSDPSSSCGHSEPLVLPVHAYGRGMGVSVIGGRVYRGATIAGASGHYFFNDIFPQGGEGAWRLIENPDEDPAVLEDNYTREYLGDGPGSFVGYAESQDGELYAFNMWGGIYRLAVGEGGVPQEAMPPTLAETGCFGPGGTPGPGLIPYDINAPLWSDGAEKARWLSVPDGEQVTLGADGDFEFPAGTVLAKEFTQEGVRVETRLFVRHPDGVWAGYSYAWMDDAGAPLTEARLLPDSVVTRPVPGAAVSWTFPSRGQCTACHTDAAGGSIGVEVGQLNRDMTYPSTGVTANQVHTLNAIGVLDGDISPYAGLVFPSYDDESASVADRAWAYMHSNCSSCHRQDASGFGGRSNMPDVRYNLFHDPTAPQHPLAELLCGVEAGAGDLGLGAGSLLVEPGAPGDWADLGAGGSVLYLRMAARPDVPGSAGMMPQIGSERVDDEHGLPLVGDWIRELSCP